MSADGSTVVGYATNASGNYLAFMWKQSLGMVDLNAYLAGLGVNMTNWTLGSATAITPDLNTIVGDGAFNGDDRAWLATGIVPVPEPSTWCLACSALFGGGSCVRRARKRRFPLV